MARAVVLLAGTIALSGCLGGGSPGARQAPPPASGAVDAVRTCSDRVESEGPVASGPEDVIVGPVVLYHLGAAVDEPRSSFDREPGFGMAWKTVVEVDAAMRVTVSVLDPAHVALVYGDGADYSDERGVRLASGEESVRFEACRAGEPRFSGPGTVGPRTQYAGGFAVNGAGCYELEVRVAGRREVLRRAVGFGVECAA